MGQAKEKIKYEEIVKNVAEKIATYIEDNDIKGSCHFVSYFYKYYLLKYHNINIKIHSGIIVPSNDSFGFHSWNSFNGKLIDLTIHKQNIVDYNCIILDNIFIDKGIMAVTYNHDQLPERYLNTCNIKAKEEYDLKNKTSLSAEEEKFLIILSDFLDMDARLNKFEKFNYSTIKELEEYLYLSDNDNERKLFFNLFDIK